MRSRIAAVAAVAVFVAAVTAVALVTDGGNDELPRLPVGPAAGAAAAEMALAMPFEIEYRMGDVSDLPRTAPAYRLEPAPALERRMRDLARVVGLRGEVDDDATGLVIEDADGRTLRVARGAGGAWSYSSSGDMASKATVSCAAPEEPQEPGADGCLPAPAQGQPSRDEAVALATKVFAASGARFDRAAVKVDDLGSERIVSVDPIVAGQPTVGLTHSVSVGPHSVISFAQGHFTRAVRLGEYPLIRADAVVRRLNESPLGLPLPYRGPPPEARRPTLTVPPLPPVRVDPPTVSIPEIEPGAGLPPAPPAVVVVPPEVRPIPPPPQPPPQPTKVVRTLTSVRPGLMFVAPVFGPDATAHLIPIFLFKYRDEPSSGATADDELPVIAVTDEHLDRAGMGHASGDHSVSFGSGSAVEEGTSESCSGSASGSGDGRNQPLRIEVCASPTNPKVGEEVTFRVTVSDPDAEIVADTDCSDEPEARFGDEEVDWERCSKSCGVPVDAPPRDQIEPRPGTLTEEHRHRYAKPGRFTAVFTYSSGFPGDCGDPPYHPYASRGTVSVNIRVSDSG